jgi:DNA-binding transcriptional ArsR family regulator
MKKIDLKKLFSRLEREKLLVRAAVNKTRKEIIKMLIDDPGMTVTDIYIKLRIEQSGASQHLAILRSEGLAYKLRSGKEQHYYINEQLLFHMEQSAIINFKYQKYYIQKNGNRSGMLRWWKDDEYGYTHNLYKAKRYTLEEAKSRTKNSDASAAHLCAKVDSIIRETQNDFIGAHELSIADSDVRGRHLKL